MVANKLIDKIENYLISLNLAYEKINDSMWVVHDEFDNIDNIVISLEEPLLIFRVRLMNIPSNDKESFFEKLLRLNTSSLVHGAYGLEDDYVVIVDTLQSENLDINEFQASIDSIVMAISNDYKELSQFLNN